MRLWNSLSVAQFSAAASFYFALKYLPLDSNEDNTSVQPSPGARRWCYLLHVLVAVILHLYVLWLLVIQC
jgi:hypothetical protein